MRQIMRASLIGFGWLWIPVSAALAWPAAGDTDGPFSAVRWTAEQAAAAGWRRAEIDVGAPDLNYATYVPENASIETAPFEGAGPNGPGRVKVVAAYKLPLSFGEIKGTVTAFQLRDTGSAALLCERLLEIDGYIPHVAEINPDRTLAQILSAQLDEAGNAARAAFTDCRTRGLALLVHHFAFSLSPASATPDLDARIDSALDVALPIVSNLAFQDGRPDGYGDAAQEIELRIGAATTRLSVPKALVVGFNDFDGRDGAKELHLLEQKDGVASAMVWLGVRDMAERPDLSKVGAQEAVRQFRLQSDDLPAPRLLSSGTIEPLKKGGSPGQAFRLAVADSQGRDAGLLEGEAYWSRGRLFIVTLYSNLGDDDRSFSALITRLPSQTAYDLVRIFLHSEQ